MKQEMSRSKVKELAKLSPEQRAKRIDELRDELALLLSKGGKTSENFKAVREVKREIAKILSYESSIGSSGSNETK